MLGWRLRVLEEVDREFTPAPVHWVQIDALHEGAGYDVVMADDNLLGIEKCYRSCSLGTVKFIILHLL